MTKTTDNLPWMKAIVQVMQSAAKPMHYKEIAQQIPTKECPRPNLFYTLSWDG